jgi:hypothetical protein
VRDTGGRIARRILFLQQFQFTFCYRPGRLNGNADGTSRITEQSVSAVFSIDSQALREAQRQDVVLSKIISAMQSGIQISEPPSFARQANKLLLKDGVLCCTYQPSRQSSVVQVVIPLSMRDTVLPQLDDAGGHLGVATT